MQRLNLRQFLYWRTFLAFTKIIPEDHFYVTTRSLNLVSVYSSCLHFPHLFPVLVRNAFAVRSRETNMASIIRPFIVFLTRSLLVVGLRSGQNIVKDAGFPNFFSNILRISSTYYHLMVVCQRAAQFQTPHPHLQQEEKGQCSELSFFTYLLIRKPLRRLP